jgi:hypothetical protein
MTITSMTIAGICELVLETDDVDRLQGFYEGLGLKRLLVEDEGRVWLEIGERCRLELWDFFRDGDGAEEGVMALAEGEDGA